MRPWLAIALGATAAVSAALTIGEYELRGWSSVVAGALVGVVIAEVIAGVARTRSARERVASSLLGAAGMTWGSWIASGRGVAPIPASAWMGAIAAVVGGAFGLGGRTTRPAEPPE